ncbi:nucleotidyltransferase domain-containing protein [Candidatus Methylobacter oryzae]|uniref:Nucleotidyltransferase n=1 Tax=Candidatus Methylobacter oryzae TaxID=2497749 RepID=A0ABY3C8X4_9GAMM|nr:nucleotidyltransferase domain-containing protein [Candidatus Methylobacter oryzae]TRW93109.1 nucleotidyltransferase [Candidatus Methylobacter oryzae]
MSTHFYVFGSLCRGETDPASDIDLLACLSRPNPEIDPKKFSIYTYERIRQLWHEGNPFAWHLHLESRLIFSSDGSDFLLNLGAPSKYTQISEDCMKFHKLFSESYHSLMKSSNSMVFHLSCMFLATRNFATCYSFGTGQPIFSRKSPLLIDRKLPITNEVFDVFARARILSTRGYGSSISEAEVNTAKSSAPIILDWMKNLSPTEEMHYERI